MLEEKLPGAESLRVSARTGSGLDRLLDAVYRRVTQGGTPREAVAVTRERHREQLARADEALLKAIESLEQNLSEEFVAADINFALQHLGAIVGKTFAEDLLDKIFSDFCVGK
jgi:tRNA modification GTPase